MLIIISIKHNQGGSDGIADYVQAHFYGIALLSSSSSYIINAIN